jgi:hypothetical protein
MLATQARVLDALFNRMLQYGISGKHIYQSSILLALKAQSQCAASIDKLKRQERLREKISKSRERTEGSKA